MDAFEKYLRFAIRFLSLRPRSIKEIRDRLTKKQASPQVIDKVIASLLTNRFVDDAEFARWWIRQRTEFRPKPKRIIMMELSQKGVAREVAEEAFADEESPFVGDVVQARSVGEKQVRRYRALPREEAKQKLAAFLARRGFSWDTITRCIDEILALQYNDK
jgi:regulatory protein